MATSPPDDGDHRGVVETFLTNPGIVDRLERDVADYLSPFGIRLERRSAGEGRSDARANGRLRSGGGGGGGAVLSVPRLPYRYSECGATTIGDAISPESSDAREGGGPIGTLRLRVRDESLLATVGPLLRTYLRLSPADVSPRRLRAVVICDFALDPLEKFDRMSVEQRRDRSERQEEICARRTAHHVHMLVRNSMGSALCLELAVVLPRYWRRRTARGGNAAEGAIGSKSKAPVAAESVLAAMRSNPDACYPSVELVERTGDDASDDASDDDDARGDDARGFGSAAMRLDVRTRMCTVRHQPALFRWVSSLRRRTRRTTNRVPGDAREGSVVDDRRSSESRPEDRDEIFESTPLVVACIEKVANLHRILMLRRDYDGGTEGDDGLCPGRSPPPDLVVILPNANADVGGGRNEDGEGGNGRPASDGTPREFEDAVDRFREAIVDPGGGGGGRFRPTFAREERAAECISDAIERRRPPSARSARRAPPSVVGIDLHPDALTLPGDYATTPASPALRRMREADAVVFGYESAGIPDAVAGEVSGWVQIPSRSSINVVAAMSIVLDALLDAGAGVDGVKLKNDRR